MSSQNQLYVLLRQALQEAELTEEEIELVYHCHLYGASRGKYFAGHRLIMVIYKLVAYISRKQREGEP